MSGSPTHENLLRHLAPQVLGILIRRYGRLDTCEDAVQEALLTAATRWPAHGVPDNPRAWLVTVATRRLTDWLRSDTARRRREDAALLATPPALLVAPPADQADQPGHDDTLTLLFLCCHPALSTPSQIALTLRAVGGLTTAEIARAFLVPEATAAQRISRAKHGIREAGARFVLPPEAERPERLRAVLHVLYLMFNEGYTATAGAQLQRPDLAADAIRLTRLLRELLPDDGEIAGLLALMLLTEARREARTRPDGSLVPLAEQDRSRWNAHLVGEGVALVTETLSRTRRLGPYQLQAAIAAVHDEAAHVEDTDWPQILALYQLLEAIAPNPVVTLNRAVAVAMVHGHHAGLAVIDELSNDIRMARHHRLHATRAHLLDMAGEPEAARDSYHTAARYATSLPEKRYLQAQATATTRHRQEISRSARSQGMPTEIEMEMSMSRSVGEGDTPPAGEVLVALPGDVGTGRGEGRAAGGDGVTASEPDLVGASAGPRSNSDAGTPVASGEGEVPVETPSPSLSSADPPTATSTTVSATAKSAPKTPRTTTPPKRLGAR